MRIIRSGFKNIAFFDKLVNRKYSNETDFEKLFNLVEKFNKNDQHSTQNNNSEGFIRVIGNGYSGSPKSLLLQWGGRKFLINCGEGTSRILMEMRELDATRTSQLDVLLTRSTWSECFSGLFGLIYTLITQQKCATVRFHAPFDAPKFLYDTFHLLRLNSILFEQHDYESGGAFCASSSGVRIDRLLAPSLSAYLFTLSSPGDTTSVMSRVLVIDCPSRRQIDELSATAAWTCITHEPPDLIAHLSSNRVFNHPEYINHIRNICGDKTRHLVFDETSPNLVSQQIYLQQLFLNELNNYCFPLLPFKK